MLGGMSVFSVKPRGICAREIIIDVDDNKIVQDVKFVGGCDGNHKGIAALAKGRSAETVASLLEGITCGRRSTSCPDQLARALKGL